MIFTHKIFAQLTYLDPNEFFIMSPDRSMNDLPEDDWCFVIKLKVKKYIYFYFIHFFIFLVNAKI